jgi:hypothetical protein
MISTIIALIPTLISFVVCVIFYNRLEPKYLRLFTWFLLFTILIQIAGYTYSIYFKKSNHFIFNIDLLVQYLFYFLIFYNTFETKSLKLLTLFGSIVVTLYAFFNFFYKNSFFIYSSATNTLGSILSILFCLLYFASLFKFEASINYFKIPMFWIATGLLFFFVGEFIYLSFIDYIIAHNIDKEGNIYSFIIVTLNLLLFSFLSIGLLSNQPWKKRR